MSIQSIIESVDAIGAPTVKPFVASTESVVQVVLDFYEEKTKAKGCLY
jgi:hypothetical protein